MYALVTGASRGIGAAVALRLAADGFDVVLNFRSRHDAAERVATDVRAKGREAVLLPFDVADRMAARDALEAMLAKHDGPPAAVVANAGIARDNLLAYMEDAEWDAVLATGLGGFYNVIRPLIAPMVLARYGRIVGMASVSAQTGNPGQVNYAAAKGGLIAACKSLAREVGRKGVTVNVVAPGLIDTEMIADLPIDRMLQIVPVRRIGRPEEVAAAVSFFCAEEAGFVTGQVLGVNGGQYM